MSRVQKPPPLVEEARASRLIYQRKIRKCRDFSARYFRRSPPPPLVYEEVDKDGRRPSLSVSILMTVDFRVRSRGEAARLSFACRARARRCGLAEAGKPVRQSPENRTCSHGPEMSDETPGPRPGNKTAPRIWRAPPRPRTRRRAGTN